MNSFSKTFNRSVKRYPTSNLNEARQRKKYQLPQIRDGNADDSSIANKMLDREQYTSNKYGSQLKTEGNEGDKIEDSIINQEKQSKILKL